MNRYPLWKYLLVAAVLLVGIVYALPNLYPEDPALQISSSTPQPIKADLQARVETLLKEGSL